jgi:hypothetical protein
MAYQSGMTSANFDRYFRFRSVQRLRREGGVCRGCCNEKKSRLSGHGHGRDLISSKITRRCNCPKVHLLVRNADHLLAHNIRALRSPPTSAARSVTDGPSKKSRLATVPQSNCGTGLGKIVLSTSLHGAFLAKEAIK